MDSRRDRTAGRARDPGEVFPASSRVHSPAVRETRPLTPRGNTPASPLQEPADLAAACSGSTECPSRAVFRPAAPGSSSLDRLPLLRVSLDRLLPRSDARPRRVPASRAQERGSRGVSGPVSEVVAAAVAPMPLVTHAWRVLGPWRPRTPPLASSPASVSSCGGISAAAPVINGGHAGPGRKDPRFFSDRTL